MGRQLLSSYRYTPIEPTVVTTPEAAEEAKETAATSEQAPPPKYTAPADLPDYEDVAEQPVVFRMVQTTDAELPVGTKCTFICHALLVLVFGVFGFFMSWCIGKPSHSRRLGRSLGVGLDIVKTAVYLRHYNEIMCWFERRYIVNDGVAHPHRMEDVNGVKVDVIDVDGREIVNYCSLVPVTKDTSLIFPIMWFLGVFLICYTLWQVVLLKRRLQLERISATAENI